MPKYAGEVRSRVTLKTGRPGSVGLAGRRPVMKETGLSGSTRSRAGPAAVSSSGRRTPRTARHNAATSRRPVRCRSRSPSPAAAGPRRLGSTPRRRPGAATPAPRATATARRAGRAPAACPTRRHVVSRSPRRRARVRGVRQPERDQPRAVGQQRWPSCRATHSPAIAPASQHSATGATSRVRGLTSGSANVSICDGPWMSPEATSAKPVGSCSTTSSV